MPNYFFECSKQHIFEAIVSYEQMLQGIPCKSKDYPKCRSKSHRIFLSPRQAQVARRFAPSLLYVREDGEVIAPGRNNPDHLPKSYRNRLHKQGFKELNITNFREYESFQRDINQRLRARADSYNSAEQEAYDIAIKEEIDSLRRGGMVEFPTEDGGSRIVKIPPLEEMHPEARRFAEYAIKEAEKMRFRSEDPNAYIEAFERDGVYYRDRDTDWKKRGY